MLINSEKGKEIFKNIQFNVEYKKVNEIDYVQKNLSEPSKPHRSIKEFWDDFERKDFQYMIKKYSKNNIILNYKYVLKKVVRKIWRKK